MGRKQKRKPCPSPALRDKPRSRAFTGCGTCRSRHLKCDEAKPTCTTCQRLNLSCQGYAPRLLWADSQLAGGDPDGKKDDASSFRYPLFTESHRSSMSLDMVQSLGDQSAADILLDLDAESVADDDLHVIGPFGVFRACQDSSAGEGPACPSDKDDEEDVEDISLNIPQTYGSPQFPANFFSDPFGDQPSSSFAADGEGSDQWMNLGLNIGLPWDDMSQAFVPDGFRMHLPSPSSGSPGNVLMGIVSTPKMPQPPPLQPAAQVSELGPKSPPSDPDACNRTPSVPFRLPSPCISNLPGSGTLPAHTAALLRYLKAEVFEDATSKPSRIMSPWKLLLFPCALETFAEVSIWNTTSYARRSILSVLLAKSAFHLSNSAAHDESVASFWLKIGVDHQREAQKHLDSALKTELGTTINYAELLMAILGVGVVSVYYHGSQVVRKLLLDAEHLIRSRGLPSTKAFGHRVLHHMYTHLRLIIESTNVISKPVKLGSENEAIPAPLPVEAVMPAQFGITAQNLGKLDPTHLKPEDVGYNDIHLEVSGIWQHTLFHEIFGVPETLMTLLSQTISLVNEKPCLEAAGLSDPAVSAALSQHIKTLEQQIWSWSVHGSSTPCDLRPSQSVVHDADAPRYRPHMESMISAMHQALIIYFYRRVYNTSAMVIQGQVRKALEFIQSCLDMEKFDADFSVSISWTTFIAVCEAASPDVQELGLKCLEAVDDRGMFIERGKPSAVAKAVWEHRRRTNDFSFGWPDLMTSCSQC